MDSVNVEREREGTINDETGHQSESQSETVAREKLGDPTSLQSSENDGKDADADTASDEIDSRLGSPKRVIDQGSVTETMEVEVDGSATEACSKNEGAGGSPERRLVGQEGKGIKESEPNIEIASEGSLGKHSEGEDEDKNVPENIHSRKRKDHREPTSTKRPKIEKGLVDKESGSLKHAPPPPSQTGSASSKRAPVKPVQNWKKAIRLPTSLEHRLASDQIFRTVLPTYVPCVPKGTSQRLVEYLTPTDLEQLCCPGCKDRFLLPSSFFRHMYRKSVKLTFTCSACEGRTLTFFNRCHLRTHVVGHMERDGVSAVVADGFDAAPLEVEELNVGYDDAFNSELDLAHSEVEKSVPSLTQCHECRLSVSADDLISHYLESSDNASAAAECQHCNMMLPNHCSLSAHGRIHEKSKPFVCPECSKPFQTWSVFHNHVQTSCLHEARVLSLTCRLCLRQAPSDEPSAAVLHQDFLGHMFRLHTKLLYKCTGCAKAFDSKTAIYAHRDELHGDASATGGSDRIEAAFTLLYKAPWLPSDKGGGNIFSSRQTYEKRLAVVSRTWKRRFGFRCLSCRTVFAAREELESHNTLWCHMQNNNGNGSSIPRLNEKSALFPSVSESKWVDKEKELEAKLEEIRKLCPQKCSHCDEMLSLLRAHFASHRKDGGTTEGPETVALSDEPKQEQAIVDPPPRKVLRSRPDKSAAPPESKSASNYDVAASPRPSAAAEIRRTTRSVAEASPTAVVTTDRKRTKQLVLKKEASLRQWSPNPVKPEPMSPSSTPPMTRSDSPPVKKKAVSKSKLPLSGPVPFVESLGKDVPSQRNLLKINRLDNKALAVGCSISTSRAGADRDYRNRDGAFSCNLCKFVTDTQISFEAHILIHKNQRYGNAFQCKECGVSFSSEASWRTHLLILHRIKAPKAADYCSDLRVPSLPRRKRTQRRGKSQEPAINPKERHKSQTDLGQTLHPDDADKADAASAADGDDEEDARLVIDERESKPFRSRQNVCSVCRSAFSSPLELQRHFRGHGMAFLKGKNPLMVAKNPLLPGLKQPRDK